MDVPLRQESQLSRRPCPYSDRCKRVAKKEKCQYGSHEPNPDRPAPSLPDDALSQPSVRSQEPCRYHNSGSGCRYADRCWFSHDKVAPPEITAATDTMTQSSYQRDPHSEYLVPSQPRSAPSQNIPQNAARHRLQSPETSEDCSTGIGCTNKFCSFQHPEGRRFRETMDGAKNLRAVEDEKLELLFQVGHNFQEGHNLSVAAKLATDEALGMDYEYRSNDRVTFTDAVVFVPEKVSKAANAYQFVSRDAGDPPNCDEALLIHFVDPHRALSRLTDSHRSKVHEAARAVFANTYAYTGVDYTILPHQLHKGLSYRWCGTAPDSFVPSISLRQPFDKDTRKPVGACSFIRSAVKICNGALIRDLDGGQVEPRIAEFQKKLEAIVCAILGLSTVSLPVLNSLAEDQLRLFQSTPYPCPPLQSSTPYVQCYPRERNSVTDRIIFHLIRFFEQRASEFVLGEGDFAAHQQRPTPDKTHCVLLAEVCGGEIATTVSEALDISAQSGGLFDQRHINIARTRANCTITLLKRSDEQGVSLRRNCRFLTTLREYPALFNMARLGSCIDSNAQPWDKCPQFGLEESECEQLTVTNKQRENATLYTTRPLLRLQTLSVKMQWVASDLPPRRVSDYRFRVVATRTTTNPNDPTILVVFPPCGPVLVSEDSRALLQRECWEPIQAYLCTDRCRVFCTPETPHADDQHLPDKGYLTRTGGTMSRLLGGVLSCVPASVSTILCCYR